MKWTPALTGLLLFCQPLAATDVVEPSFGKMGLQKKLFRTYSRTQVTDTSAFPFRIVGQLEDGCSGTLIGPKHILTAGHCIYNFQTKSWNENLNFYPARIDDKILPYGIIRWKKAMVMEEYLKEGKNDNDIAVIELETDIGNIIGWSGFKVLPENEYNNKVRVTGYPGDMPTGTMWSVTCPSSVSEMTYTYQCDTWGGMSGSGIFSQQPNPDTIYITGVHTFGGEVFNGGVILNSANFHMILSWRNDSVYTNNTIVHERADSSSTLK